MYQALYRKWRPKSFADVVGQGHITHTLQREVAEGRLSHAYLFTGTRGTGKTTCAKILAKAVNCDHPVDGDPCGQCPACTGIDNGSLLDVLELDAASNNGVDHVRALREEAIYTPARVRYRVYIIDEVHMLTTAAFNALLKILEEPPAHLIFILATTELHKVPATILSRCQRFAFKRILPRDMAERLLYVARQEGIGLTESGAEQLSRLSDGALRDALSLLDQCAAAGGTVDGGRILEVLGLAGNLQTQQLMEHILRRDAQSALTLFHQLYSGGRDAGAVVGELSALCRDLLIRMTAPQGGDSLLTGGYEDAALEALSTLCAPRRLIFLTAQLQSTAAALPLSVNRRTDVELCLLRMCDESLSGDLTALSARITRLEEGRPAQPAPAAPVRREAAPPRREAAPPPADEVPWEEPPLPEPPPELPAERQRADLPLPEPILEAPVPAGAPKAAATDSGLWGRLIDSYKSRLPAMYRAFLDGAVGELTGDMLTVSCGSDFIKTQLHNVKVQSVLQEVTSEDQGRPIAVAFTVGAPPKAAETAESSDKIDDLIRFGSQFDNFKIT